MIMENFDDAIFEEDEFIEEGQDSQGIQKTDPEPENNGEG